MRTRTIGSLEVSLVGLGCNNFGMRIDEDTTSAVVNAALDEGITFFDTADSYGATRSEEWLGRALGKRRTEAVIGTKFASRLGPDIPGGAAPGYVREAVDASLRRLNVDVIDLYQLHRPDPETPIADTLAALGEIVAAGKVREIGCSNFSAAQLREADAAVKDGAPRFVSVQNHYNLLNRADEAEVLPACEMLGVAYLPFFPLASGLLTGKYRRGEEPPDGTRIAAWGVERMGGLLVDHNFDVIDRLAAFASARGHTVGELAISWLAARPVVASVIAGATSVTQVHANAAGAAWTLSDAEVIEIDEIAMPGLRPSAAG